MSGQGRAAIDSSSRCCYRVLIAVEIQKRYIFICSYFLKPSPSSTVATYLLRSVKYYYILPVGD
jgi:hypothetical protein